VFVWTPPHFWALAILIKDNYAAANVPMLPVVQGDRETARQIVLYSLGLVAVTLLPWAWGTVGLLYLASALALGAVFVWLTVGLLRKPSTEQAMRVFGYSITYVTLLFAAMAIDQLVRNVR